MEWKPIDFHGIVTLNRTIADQLHHYLDEKEGRTAKALLDSIPPAQSGKHPIPPPLSSTSFLKLSEAVEGFGKAVRAITEGGDLNLKPNDWSDAAGKINRAFWDYFEVLEECVVELFQQLDQVGVEQWREDLSHVVDTIKEMLYHRMDELRWTLPRVETYLRQYRWACEKNQGGLWLKKLFLFWKPLVDRSLSGNLVKCQKYLAFRHQSFVDRFSRYQQINRKVFHTLEKFTWYHIFNTLDTDFRDNFKEIYRLTRLWELNASTRSMPQRKTVLALRNLVLPEKALAIFKEYYRALRNALFDKSRGIKAAAEPPDASQLHDLQEEVLTYRGELHTLGATITKYRDFLLRTDPNPYVRSRLGFPEWVVGPEPVQTKQLMALSYEVERLDGLLETFRQAMERKAAAPDTPVAEIDPDVQALLHEMTQPLTSRAMMRVRAERLMALVQQAEELTSNEKDMIPYIGRILAKAMRADWKYHVLYDIPAFQENYAIHMGLVGAIGERSHDVRMSRFRALIQQIEQWIQNNDTPRHTHEIELDMSDMKGYLQDFLASVQRLVKEETLDADTAQRKRDDVSNQLLEYRYEFGNFFRKLRDDKPEERMIRNQFLFVDQYFEAVENLLHDWKIQTV